MIRKFASLKDPNKYGYAFDSDCYDSKAFFSDKFRMFETYGDGLCQHSRDWAVAVDHFADYLASLAKAMLTDEELLSHARWEFRHGVDQRDIAFAAGVIFKSAKNASGEDVGYEKTRRYFSVSERKISSNPNKEYDKRYQRVEQWCNGSTEAIYRMLIPEYAKGMEYYATADALRNWCQETTDEKRPYFYGLTAQFLKWFNEESQPARELRYAWNACIELFKAREARDAAETALNNLHWATEPAQEESAA